MESSANDTQITRRALLRRILSRRLDENDSEIQGDENEILIGSGTSSTCT